MKNITIILTLILALMSPLAADARGDKKDASIKFEKLSHDFGTIKEQDGKVTCDFTFTNKGDAPLVIISANASCGCTKPVVPQEPVAPGKKATITVSYNPDGRPGEFTKTITVRTNDPKHKKVVLKITGVVVPDNQ